MTIRSVVFDLDDTLYLERDYVLSGFRSVGVWVEGRLGPTDFAARAWVMFAAGRRGDVFNAVLSDLGLEATQELVETLVRLYRQHAPAISWFPDSLRLVRQLHGRLPMAVITDGPVESQRSKIASLRVEKWFDPIVITEELGWAKPDRRAFKLTSESHQAEGAECVYIADNPRKDFEGPKLLNWQTVRVRRSAGFYSNIASGPDVDFEVPDCERLPNILALRL